MGFRKCPSARCLYSPSMLLTEKLTLHDPQSNRYCHGRGDRCVHDAEAFVRDSISKSRLRLSLDELDDLIGEGLRILTQLHRAYEPGRNGLDPAKSKWAGFASDYLGRKLSDANHRLHENHRLVTDGDGKRHWVYDPKAASLDAMVEDNAAEHLEELQSEDGYDSNMARTLRDALQRRWEHDRETTVKFGVLLGMGYTVADAVKSLRIPSREATFAMERIKDVAHELQVAA